MGLFDWFAADIACRACGGRVGAEASTGAQTKLHPSPRQNYLRVGSALPVSAESAAEAGYERLHPERPFGAEVRILQAWDCRHCDAFPQWLEVTVRDGVIVAIAPVSVDADVLGRADLVDSDDRQDFLSQRA